MSDVVEQLRLVSLAGGMAVPSGRSRGPAGPPFGAWDPCSLLTVEEVACLLRCSVDTVLRIPKNRLAAYRPGRQNLYFVADVIEYVRRHCRIGGDDGSDIAGEAESWQDKLADRVRGRSQPKENAT